MANTAKNIISLQALKNTSEKGQLGRNYGFEVWEITGTNDDTDVVITTQISVPHFISVCGVSIAPPTGLRSTMLLAGSGGNELTVTFNAAVGTGKIRVKIEGIP